MFKFSGFTGKANAAVNAAIAQACVLGHTYVGSEHLLLGLLEEDSGIAGNIPAFLPAPPKKRRTFS